MAVTLLRRKFTVEQYHQMVEAGILSEDDRVELIRGEIIEMSPIGRRHAANVKRINALFMMRLGQSVTIGVQDPIQLDNNSEPQPDISILRRRGDFYLSGHPQPQDILLLIEVADTTIETDREVKILLYADANILEVWLVDIDAECVEVYRQPSPTGYQIIQKFYRGQTLSIQTLPDINITVDEILG